MADYDVNFWWDPVCPFAWMTSRWVHQVAAQRDYSVDWRLISLRMLNKNVDYEAEFPPEYMAGHTAGLRMLRVAARARAEHGRDCLDGLYTAFGTSIFDSEPRENILTSIGGHEEVESILEAAGLPVDLADALDDESFDAEIDAETEAALALTGRDVGTPIIQFQPPEGPAFFGPVISRLPPDDRALELWDHVIGLATFPSFAELKRSLRELPQLRGLGVDPDEMGKQEDWHGGSRRPKK